MSAPPDLILLSDLEVRCIVGVLPHERRFEQTLRLDLEIGMDTRPAARSDALADALDYDALARNVRALCVEGRFHLIETLAERVASLALRDGRVVSVTVRVKKPQAIPGAGYAGVEITRARPS